MIRFIYGNPGTGKTEKILSLIEQDAADRHKALLIVPEQMTVAAEREVVKRLPPSAQLYIEVLNFTRLANKVFRIKGGLAYNFASPAFQKLLMMRAIRAASPFLCEYKRGGKDDISLADAMLSTLKELTASGISLESLEMIANTPESSVISDKLKDITTVCSIYLEMLGEKYTDTNNELSRFAELIKGEIFFSDTNIYIDGFSSFTGLEHNIIKTLFSQSENIAISIGISSPSYRGIDTVSLKRCSDRLRRDCASLGSHAETLILSDNKRSQSPELKALSDNLWNMTAALDIDKQAQSIGSVKLIRAADIYDECEMAAAYIRELIESGYRYKDIVIVARDTDKYRGIIEPALENMELSYFISDKTDASLCPLSRLILSAIRIALLGWKRSDVIAHLKTGLCGISASDADIFESYAAKWNISGKQFLSEEPWNMNPDGYTTTRSERGEKIISISNSVKEAFVSKLKIYIAELKNSETYAELCVATVRYLEKLNVRNRMLELSAKYLSMNRPKEAGEYARMYDTVLDALECVCDAMNDETATDLSTFYTALHTALSESKLGSIPTSSDEITIGSADMLRADNVKCTVILGACDGEFPANPTASGLLTDRERQFLIDHEIQLEGDREVRASDELYFFRRAVSSPSEKLLIFTRADSEPSMAFTRISKMFSYIRIHNTDSDLLPRLRTLRAASEYAGLIEGTTEGNAIYKIVEERENNIDLLLPSCVSDITAVDEKIDDSAVNSYIGNTLYLSQSKIETYVNCNFSYACKYILNLDEGEKAEFAYNNIGTFVHHVLEKYLYYVFITNKGIYPDMETRDRKIDAIISEYIGNLIPNKRSDNARLKHLLERLKITSILMIDDLLNEFNDSDFRPEFFELKIGTRDIPSIRFTLSNDTQITVSGIIDRVDLFRDNENAYIRVVDYKTGSKTFSVSDISEGLNLQLLLYLFALTTNRNTKFSESIGAIPQPAGIAYLSSPGAKIKALVYNSDEVARRTVLNEIKRSGLIVDDENILNAVSHSENNRYLMQSSRKRSTVSYEGLEQLYNQVGKILTDIGNEIVSGQANARPKPGTDACKYCSYSHICRAAKRKND